MRPDDRGLTVEQRELVEKLARKSLEKADAWNVVPVPIDDILDAAKLKVSRFNVFDPKSIAAYAIEKGQSAANKIKSAVGKILGVLDSNENVIHIDETLHENKQKFLKLHETGHFEIPHQKKLFSFFEDSNKELDPNISDLFEREANNFASFVLFNGNSFGNESQNLGTSFASVKKMQSRYKASMYASLREYARTHRYPCITMALELPEDCANTGFKCEVRRIEISQSFLSMFGTPQFNVIDGHHGLSDLVPKYSKITRPTTFILTDLNGEQHEFIGEALNTTYNILVFACPTVVFEK